MDKLFERADLAISDSRRLRTEAHSDLAEARIGVVCARKVLQRARTENERAKAALAGTRDSLQPGERAGT